MNVLTFEELLSKDDGRRKIIYSDEYHGDVEIYELSAVDAKKCLHEFAEGETDDMDKVLKKLAKWSGLMLKGSPVTASEIKCLTEKYSREFLMGVRDCALFQSGETIFAKEQIEKN